MMKIKLNILPLFFIMIMLQGIKAQQVNVSAELEKDTILIGDQISFTLNFTGPGDALVDWPFFQDTITENIELIQRSKIDSVVDEESNTLNLHQNLIITSFDSGYYKIPAVDFFYMLPGNTSQYHAFTQAEYLLVNTVQVDTTAAIKPIKGPMHAPYTFREFLPWFFGIICVIILILIIIWYRLWRKKEKKFTWVKPKPKLPPHVVALNDLEKLRRKKLWQAEKYKEFYTELTDILRIYLDGRFGINAMEMTSVEIIERILGLQLDNRMLGKVSEVIYTADMVKFAKEKPLPTENDKAQKTTEEFVKDTIPRMNNNGGENNLNDNNSNSGIGNTKT